MEAWCAHRKRSVIDTAVLCSWHHESPPHDLGFKFRRQSVPSVECSWRHDRQGDLAFWYDSVWMT